MASGAEAYRPEASSSTQTTLMIRTTRMGQRVQEGDEDLGEDPGDREDQAEGPVDPAEAEVDLVGQVDLAEAMAVVIHMGRYTRSSGECKTSRRGPSSWRKRGTRIRTVPGTRRI